MKARLLDKPEARLSAAGISLLVVMWPFVGDLGWSPGTTVVAAFTAWLLVIGVLAFDALLPRLPKRERR